MDREAIINMFSGKTKLTEDQEKQLKISKEIEFLLSKYEEKFNEEICTETLLLPDEQFIKSLKRCLEENITLDVIYPGINDYDEDDDL